MTNTIPPLAPDLHSLQTRANFEGITPEKALDNFIQQRTGGVRTEVLDKLDARRAKAEAELAKIQDEKDRQLGIAAHRNSLAGQLAQLRERLEYARGQLGLHRQWAATGLENARQHLGKQGYNEAFAGELLLGHLNQTAIASAMEPLVSELEAEVSAKEAEVAAFDREHGIVVPAA